MTALPPDFFDKEKPLLVGVLQPFIARLVAMGITASEKKLAQFGIYFDNLLAHEAGAKWARTYTDDLLNLLNTTSSRAAGQAIASWLETPGATVGDLKALLAPMLADNISRADAVAVTETTRAVAQGNIIGYTQAGAVPPPDFMGADHIMRPFGPPGHVNCRCDTAFVRYKDQYLIVWLTNRDDLVCVKPIKTPWGVVRGCSALHGVCISAGAYLGKRIA